MVAAFSSTDSSSDDPVYTPPRLQPPRALSLSDERAWSSSSDDDGEAGSALGLALPSAPPFAGGATLRKATLKPTSVPFSRPPSAVTVPFPPSRPTSAAPPAPVLSSPARTRRIEKRSVGPESPLERVSVGRRESGARAREDSGKGKARERAGSAAQANGNGAGYDDPLDPLSSVHRQPAPPPAQTKRASVADRQLASYPSSDSVASTSQLPSTQPSTQPTASPAQPSLQQLLESVDLSAALLLVHTIQAQQKAPVPAPPAPISVVVPPPPPPAQQRELPPRSTTRSHATGFSHTSGASLSTIDPTTPLLTASPFETHISIAEEPTRIRPASVGGPPPSLAVDSLKRDRRRTLSLSFGAGSLGMGKRVRTNSSAASPTGPNGVKVRERVPDERASLPEAARAFEADISRVHLSLSPATMRRAQNCAKYLQARYTPIFSALAGSEPPPTLLEVARFREHRVLTERLARRAKVGPSTRPHAYGSLEDIDARSDGGGSSLTGRLDPAVPSAAFGQRRNKHPKAWEVYPDDLDDYVQSLLEPAPIDTRASISSIDPALPLQRSSPERVRAASYEHSPLGSPLRERAGGYFQRPSPRSRENSYESSPLGPASPLRRAGSLGSAPGSTPRSNFASLSSAQLQDALSRPLPRNASREQLSEPPSPLIGSNSPAHVQHRHSQSDGLRSGVKSLANRWRGSAKGTDVESGGRRNDSVTDLAELPSDADASPSRPPLRSLEGSDDGGPRTFGLRRIRKARKNGRGTTTDREDSARPRAPVVVRRPFGDESEDEDLRPVRETIDLADEDFLRLNSALRQLRGQLAHVDVVLPRVPAVLNSYLDTMSAHEIKTLNTVGIAVDYAFPRFTASIVSQLAHDKKVALVVDSPSSSSASSSSESDSDDERPHPVQRHSRRVTDPIHQPPATRLRSQTVAGPDRRLAHPSGREVDPLALLEKAIADLDRTARDVDDAAERVGRNQDRVGREIGEVVQAVDEVEKAIEDSHLQQLRMLEDHYFRLRTSLTRPSTSIDLFWAALSYFLTALFWLSWLIVTLVRLVRAVVAFPIHAVRWLFFLR